MAEERIYTDEQRDAIVTRGKNLLVAAAAGSGKTMVMVDRIIGLITGGEAEVDEMLIVTFTNLAATEMKIKITNAIKEAMEADSDTRDKLSSQLDKLYRAYISTFDKFSGRIIKEFFYKVDVSPDYSVCDNVKKELLLRDAMAALFDELFVDDSAIPGCSFRDFLMHYSAERSEESLKSEMIGIYEKIRSMPEYFDWAEEKALMLKLPEGGYKESQIYEYYQKQIKEDILRVKETVELYLPLFDENRVPNMRAKVIKAYKVLLSVIEDCAQKLPDEDVMYKILGIKFPPMRTTENEKDDLAELKAQIEPLRGKAKDIVHKIHTNIKLMQDELLYEEMDATYKYTKYYIDMLKRFEEIYLESKQEENLMDFADINHMAYRILCDEEVSGILRDRFKYIFIDEYQDTNNLQEEIISKIAGRNNLFKVGDVKQSIYGFRQAEPQIFLDTLERYAGEEESENIDLNRNFRCNHGTVNFVNKVFFDLMEGYDDKSALYAGLDYCGEYDFKPDVHFVYTEDAVDEGTAAKSAVTKNEKEAEYIADIIARLIGTTFYDSSVKEERNRLRKVEPKDIVVLMNSVKKMGGLINKKLIEKGIKSFVSEDEGYFDTVEIEVMLALLNVIDNSHQDISLISVLHSEIFGFTPEELAIIRTEYTKSDERNRYKSFRDALIWYKESNREIKELCEADERSKKIELSDKISTAVSKLSEWRSQRGLMPLEDYIWYLLVESKYYIFAGAMRDGNQRQANLRVLVDKALNFRLNGVSSLSGFIRYLNILKKKGIRTGEAVTVGEKDNLVRIMTIHKSKGLEFPFVIVAGLENQLNYSKLNKEMIIDGSIGLALPYVNREIGYKRNTLMQQYIMERINLKEFEERKRVLYVALTRARQKLILTSTIKNQETLDKLLNGSVTNIKMKYIKMIAHALDGKCCNIVKGYAKEFGNSYYMRVEDYLKDRENKKIADSEKFGASIAERLDYKYEGDTTIKAKYTVSELNNEMEFGANAGSYIRYPSEIIGSEITAAEVGTGYHRLMEYMDFTKCIDSFGNVNRTYIERCFLKLIETKAIPAGVSEQMDIRKVASFFESDIGKKSVEAAEDKRLFKEKAFTLEMTREGKDILVQGVIDCLIENGEKAILVDYKSNRMKGNCLEEKIRIRDTYKTQIEIYKDAVEKGIGINNVESYLYLFDIGELISMN